MASFRKSVPVPLTQRTYNLNSNQQTASTSTSAALASASTPSASTSALFRSRGSGVFNTDANINSIANTDADDSHAKYGTRRSFFDAASQLQPILPITVLPFAPIPLRSLRRVIAAVFVVLVVAGAWFSVCLRSKINLRTPSNTNSNAKNFGTNETTSYSPTTRLRLSHPLTKSQSLPRKFSYFSCIGDENSADAFRERICVFNNVCYNLQSDKFSFHAKSIQNPSNPRQSKSPSVLFDSTRGERLSFFDDGHGFVALWQTTDIFGADSKNTWAPEIVDSPLPTITDPKNTISLPNLHAIWSLWAYDDNLGHILWEEMAGLYFAMSRMNVLTDNLIAMHYPYDLPTRKLSIKFRQAFFPGISKTQPVNLREYVSSVLISNGSGSIAQNICFEQLLVGGNMRRFLHSVAWHNHGHEEMFRNLRANILTAHGIDPTSTPNESHHIVITNKTETNFKADSTVGERKRAIANLDEVVAWIKDKYGPNIEVSCVEWQKMSVKDQLNLMVSATVFISPPGGVSMMLPFLPNGAHAIIMDYLENEPNNWYGTRVGDSISMESPFWNHWPHVKKLYYQIHGKQDMVSDSTSKTLDEVSWREGVSYVIDMTRLEGLLEQAFHTMEN